MAVFASFDPFPLNTLEPTGLTDRRDPGAHCHHPAGPGAADQAGLMSPNSTKIILHKVLVTNLQAEELPREVSEEDTIIGALELAPTGNLLVTLALEPADAERLVFAAEHGSVWLAVEGNEVSDADTAVQTRGIIYEAPMSLVIAAAVDAAFEQRVRDVLPRPVTDTVQRWDGSLTDADELKAVADRSPSVVILGPELGEDDAFERAHRFDRYHPAICVLVVAVPGARHLAAGAGRRGPRGHRSGGIRRRTAHPSGRALEIARQRAAAGGVAEPARPRVVTVVSPEGRQRQDHREHQPGRGTGGRAPRARPC